MTKVKKVDKADRSKKVSKTTRSRRINRANQVDRVRRAKKERKRSVTTNRIRVEGVRIDKIKIRRVIITTQEKNQGRLTKNMIKSLDI